MLFPLLIAFVLSLLLTWLVRFYAIKKAIIDIPNDRSSHTVPTPRGGGLAFVIVWFGFLIWFKAMGQIDENLFLALLSSLPLVIIGILDDMLHMSPKVRMIIQILSASLALYFLGGLKVLDVGLFKIELYWLLIPLSLIGILWSVNLYNFIDGIDGYAATQAIVVFGTIALLFMDVLAVILAASVAGFLVWNWQKARIFMGDVGSTLLGFNVAVFAIYYQNEKGISLIVFLLLFAIFWMDATITLFRRFRNKEKLSQAHRKHAYQRLVQSGWSHQKTVLVALLFNFLMIGLAFAVTQFSQHSFWFLLIGLLIVYSFIKIADKRKRFV